MKTPELVDEISVFPTGSHDDMVDAMVHCMIMFKKYGSEAVIIQEKQQKIRPTSFEIKDNMMPNLVALDEESQKHRGPDWRIG